MPLPLIPVAIALVAASGGGAGAGTFGFVQMKDAKKIAKAAQESYEVALARHGRATSRTSEQLGAYGERQLEVQATTLADWADWLETNDKKVKRLQRGHVVDMTVAPIDLPELKRLVQQAKLARGGAGAALSAIAAQQAALAGVQALATASTGTAIAGLSGAAAESATLAWLGGGSLAAGGGGVAAGGMVLTGVAVAPALLIGGITLAVQGDKALTQARKYEGDVAVAVEEIRLQVLLLARLRKRLTELHAIIDRLDQRASRALKKLQAVDFDPDLHLELFQETALLMAELGHVLNAALLDEDGDLSASSLAIIERYAA